METYRLVKETEYLRLFSKPDINFAKLPELARETNFDIIMNDVMNDKYSDEFEKAAAVQRAMQNYITFQHKVKPSSYDRIAPGAEEVKQSADEQSVAETQVKKPVLSQEKIKKSRDEATVSGNQVFEKKTRGKKQTGTGKRKKLFQGGWLSWTL